MQLFILLLLLSRVAVVTAVAGCHGDRDKDHRPRENCTAAGFSDVPAGFEPTTKVLLFPRNLFSGLSWSSFTAFSEIYEIDLTGNKVPQVPPSAAPLLPSLSVLRLGSNRLAGLPDGSFSACPALTELYLENNAMEALSDGSFSGLSRLEILDLSSNRIAALPALMLHPLVAIETLFLEENKIRVMPDGWFSQKEEVPYLYLSANPWACACSLGYLRRYLDEYDYNIYVRDGVLIRLAADSVVCDSPPPLRGTPVIHLEEADLCSGSAHSAPTGDLDQPPAATADVTLTVRPQVVTLPPRWAPPPRAVVGGARGAGVFCWWLLAGGLLLCAASAASTLVTAAALAVWFRRVHPLGRGEAGGEGLKLLTYCGREGKEVGGGGGGGGGTVYRSVLLIHRDGGGAVQREDGGMEGEGGGGRGEEHLLVPLEPTRGGRRGEGGAGGEERGVYRKTVYRLISREEEVDGWRDVMEEWKVSAEGGGRRREEGGGGGEGGGASRKCYSVILREEREEAGGRREELDWVVGGWEVKRGGGGEEGEEPRSSWGEWLAHYLPSMPWGVATPPDDPQSHGHAPRK